jgi:hypothetical protein
MKTMMTTGMAMLLALAVTSAASAQSSASFGHAGHGAAGFYPAYGGYGYGYHSSTYEEGVLRGWGALARARGEANYWNSVAAVNRQEALARYIQNREQATETYFRMRQINQAARQAERPQRLSPEQYVMLAKKQAPDNLSEVQYDRTLGRLSWPAVFQTEEFAAEREELNRAFLVRSPSDTGAGSAFHSHVRQLTSAMHDRLTAKIHQLSPAEFIAAKKFVDGLGYEAQQPLVVRALASAE